MNNSIDVTIKRYTEKSDIKYKDFKKLESFISEEGFDMTNRNNLELLNRLVMKTFYGLDTKTIRLLKLEQIELLVSAITNILNEPVGEMKRIITYKDKQYGLIPNFSKTTYGTLIDLDDRYKEKDIISLMSILYRPIKGKINRLGEYDIEDYDGYNNTFEEVTIDITESVMDFFVQSYRQLNFFTPKSTQSQA